MTMNIETIDMDEIKELRESFINKHGKYAIIVLTELNKIQDPNEYLRRLKNLV